MTEKRPTPEQSAGKGRRKRAAPTIDLTATDLTPNEVPPATSEAEPPPPEAMPVQESPIQETSAPEAPRTESISSTTSKESAAKPAVPAGFGMTMPMLAAGVAGAVAMSVILFGLWLTGLVPIRYAGSTAIRARVTGLEMQIQDLQKRPVQSVDSKVVDTQAVDALTQRVAKMEDSIKNLPASSPAAAGLADRVAAADNAMKSLGLALTALSRRSDEISATSTQARERAEAAEKAVTNLRASLQDVSKAANAGASSADLEPLQQRIAALEQSAKAANAAIAKTSASDAATRLALSAAALRDTVLRGAQYTGELAQAKSLGADAKVLAALVPYAASGVPSEKSLAAELSTLLLGMIKSAGAPPASGSFIERLQANAGKIVRIRPVEAPVGDDAATVLSRLEVDAARADIAASLSDLGKLPEAQRAPAQAWIVKAQSRQAALAAARQFAVDTARSLGSR